MPRERARINPPGADKRRGTRARLSHAEETATRIEMCAPPAEAALVCLIIRAGALFTAARSCKSIFSPYTPCVSGSAIRARLRKDRFSRKGPRGYAIRPRGVRTHASSRAPALSAFTFASPLNACRVLENGQKLESRKANFKSAGLKSESCIRGVRG